MGAPQPLSQPTKSPSIESTPPRAHPPRTKEETLPFSSKKSINRENSCLTEKETSPGYAGPSFAFYECYDRSKNEVNDITTYISEKQKIRETEACPQELQNCL